MKVFGFDSEKIPLESRDWGALKFLFDSKSVGSKSKFTFGHIVYDKPHYSGLHDDHEIIYILKGEGVALIGKQEINFGNNYLLVIPAGTKHSISRIEAGPVEAIFAHFT